jgi:hypothetical protein
MVTTEGSLAGNAVKIRKKESKALFPVLVQKDFWVKTHLRMLELLDYF